MAGAGRRDGGQPVRHLAEGRGGGCAGRADPAPAPDQRAFREAHGAAFAEWVAEPARRGRPRGRELPRRPSRAGRLDGRLPEHPARGARTRPSTTGSPVLRRLTDDEMRADLRETTQAPLAPALMAPRSTSTSPSTSCAGCGPTPSRPTGPGASGSCAPTSWRVPPSSPGTAGARCCATSGATASGSATGSCASTATRCRRAPSRRAAGCCSCRPTPTAAWWAGTPHRYALYYPVAGRLARVGATNSAGLAPLVGAEPGRGAGLLDVPRSTSQLAVLTGQALGSVGGHLKVLLEVGTGPAAPLGARGPLLAHRARRRAGGCRALRGRPQRPADRAGRGGAERPHHGALADGQPRQPERAARPHRHQPDRGRHQRGVRRPGRPGERRVPHQERDGLAGVVGRLELGTEGLDGLAQAPPRWSAGRAPRACRPRRPSGRRTRRGRPGRADACRRPGVRRGSCRPRPRAPTAAGAGRRRRTASRRAAFRSPGRGSRGPRRLPAARPVRRRTWSSR